MNGRPVKRSLTINGHRTSVSLEDPFWNAFGEIAKSKGLAINTLAARIDAERDLNSGLATSIRVYILQHLQSELDAKIDRS